MQSGRGFMQRYVRCVAYVEEDFPSMLQPLARVLVVITNETR